MFQIYPKKISLQYCTLSRTTMPSRSLPLINYKIINISENMVAMKIRYEEGSYDGEVNDAKTPEGKGTFEYRSD